ncbi:MAG: GntR family transcriptional regulator [Phycisphaerae bacterium]|nr:GntR family transcriptional regulator [Phycisphaerae bacterium]
MARPEIIGRILEHLLRGLAAETWPSGSRLPSTRQLAQQLCVSQDTVLLAVQRAAADGLVEVRPRSPAMVRPEAASRARELLAERQRCATVSRVAVLFEEGEKLADPFFTTFLGEAHRLAAERDIELHMVEWPLRRQIELVQALPAQGFRGAIGLSLTPSYWVGVAWMQEHSFPIIVINRSLPSLAVSTVRGNAYEVVQRLARHLIRLGHRNLCLVSHFVPGAVGAGLNEVDGWLQALDEAGLMCTSSLPLCVLPRIRALRENPHTFANLFCRPDRPTAVVFTSPLWAEELLSDPRFGALKVPGDISVAVLNMSDPPLTVPGLPPLTRMCPAIPRQVECVFQVLLEMFAGDLTPRRLLLPIGLTLTESIGPPPVGLPRCI